LLVRAREVEGEREREREEKNESEIIVRWTDGMGCRRCLWKGRGREGSSESGEACWTGSGCSCKVVLERLLGWARAAVVVVVVVEWEGASERGRVGGSRAGCRSALCISNTTTSSEARPAYFPKSAGGSGGTDAGNRARPCRWDGGCGGGLVAFYQIRSVQQRRQRWMRDCNWLVAAKAS
jgi:hypothetical protein